MGNAFGRKMVIALTGTTRMQLEHWDRQGVAKPSARTGTGKGSRKAYSFRDLVQVRVAKRLRDSGITLQKVRKTLVYLRRHFPEITEPLAELRFLTDGKDVFVLTQDPNVVLDTLKGQLVFSLALGDLINGLKGDLSRLAVPRKEVILVKRRPFIIVLTRDMEGGFRVVCNEIPSILCTGVTEQEAIDNVIDALESHLGTEKSKNSGREMT